MEKPSTISDTDHSSERFGLSFVKCDRQSLLKIGFDEEIILRLPLSEIYDLEAKSSLRWPNLVIGPVLVALTTASFYYLESALAKWPLGIILGLVAISYFTDMQDRYIFVSAKEGKFKLDVEDFENEHDIDAFVVGVRGLIRERKESVR